MAHPSPVDPDETIAEALPHLFREVLDGLAHLEQLGARGEAARLRAREHFTLRAQAEATLAAFREVLRGGAA